MTLLTAAAVCAAAAPAPAHAATVAASRPLVVLLHPHVARTRPNSSAHRLEVVGALRPLTRVRTVLPVIGRSQTRNGHPWVRVRLPGRPIGHTGWIRASGTRRAATDWHVAIKLSARQVTVYSRGRAKRRFKAIVGKPSTPTPRGRFFIEEAVRLSPVDAGGPFALATSARSQVLQEFEGGPGQIALHGTNNLSGALGTAASHGCVRLSTGAIRWMAARIGGGVPLTITR